MFHMTLWQSSVTILLIVFAGGLIVGKLTEKPRIPDVAAYLVFGILIGPAVFNLVAVPSQSQVNQLVLNVGAALILFDGGRGVQFQVLRKVWISVVMLAIVGVLVTALAMGVAAHLLLGIPWMIAILLGSVIASTDPATLIPVFKRVPIIPKLQQTVESESAFNDATGAVLVFTVMSMIAATGGHVHWYQPVFSFLHSAIIGLIVGVVFGLLSIWLVSKRGWSVFHEYGSVVMLTVALASFQVANAFGASGFMAAFTAGMITGNGESFGLPFLQHTEENIHHFGTPSR
ncbi:cation:proton antiporter [Alicyclobacillus herbarius]|uniref:cation:proton antiporter n=1 Tax=Alicyclobacillus herbarius TaxID=122960 RepID=UPI00040374CA|nr:cation:proton antiporter [Alicyclobacillus herbarius]